MEPLTAFFDEEWESLSRMFTSTDDADFMLQLHGSDINLLSEEPSNFWPVNVENVAGVGESFFCYDHDTTTSIDYTNNFQNTSISQDSCNSTSPSDTSVVLPNLSHEFNQANDTDVFQLTNDTRDQSMDFYVMDEKNEILSVQQVFPDGSCPREENANDKLGNAESDQTKCTDNSANYEELLLKRKHCSKSEAEDKLNNDTVENPKKKSRVSRNAQKNKRDVQPKAKKNQKVAQISTNEEEANAAQNRQSCCSYNSEDDSNASQESNGGETSDTKEPAALNLNGKTRASRGSATDPQSLYARKRRERINERLRILQNLIPNGTKVDISTMLEEAVHYVKFLQLQIKLLSSDDMWMYAPIVYNGLDIGMYGRIFPTL
ncbi:hypothetical protein ACH5RR_034904 [Cinchona calisaya]|uniref:BHLH domain-containing protein n=1 Tax=Cinchona calisaya TaxID=153742 RepID=A0ABD2YC99_9GENT